MTRAFCFFAKDVLQSVDKYSWLFMFVNFNPQQKFSRYKRDYRLYCRLFSMESPRLWVVSKFHHPLVSPEEMMYLANT